MSDLMERPASCEEDKIIVDGAFLRQQAGEAVETFFAPLAGVVAAAKGRRVHFFRRKRVKRNAA